MVTGDTVRTMVMENGGRGQHNEGGATVSTATDPQFTETMKPSVKEIGHQCHKESDPGSFTPSPPPATRSTAMASQHYHGDHQLGQSSANWWLEVYRDQRSYLAFEQKHNLELRLRTLVRRNKILYSQLTQRYHILGIQSQAT